MNTEPSSLTIRFRGVRGSIPSPGNGTSRYGGNTSCIELRCDDHLLILDAGSGIRELGNDLMKNSGGQPVQADLLISHTHWDHIQGFPFFAPAYAAGNRIRILKVEGLTDDLQTALCGQMQSMHFPVSLDRMVGICDFEAIPRRAARVGPYTVHSSGLNHPGGCAGFRVETTYGSIAYLPDHEPYRLCSNGVSAEADERALIDFIRSVDLLILDTQYTEEEYLNRVGWGHGCLRDSVALAEKAHVGELAFFHHDPCHNDNQVDEMVGMGRGLARNGLTIYGATEMETRVLTRKSSAVMPPLNHPIGGCGLSQGPGAILSSVAGQSPSRP